MGINRASKSDIVSARTCLGLLCFIASTAWADSDSELPAASSGAAPALALAAIDLQEPLVGKISIQNDNIFDLDNPEEDRALFRLANRLHIKTRQDVIAQQLLFTEGDVLSVDELEETERILRNNRYIHEAWIEPVRRYDGKVDVNVHTTDVWTLMPRLSVARAGGVNKANVGLKETNLLGKGIAVEAMYKSDVDRDSFRLGYADQNIGSSWYSLNALFSDNSDGHERIVEFGKPFYSFDSRLANGISFADVDRVDSLYDGGVVQARFRHTTRSGSTHLGWSDGRNRSWTRRYIAGVAYDVHDFSSIADDDSPLSIVPENRRFIYPFVGIDLVEERFEKTRNVEQIAEVEDLFLGTRVSARLGYASTVVGSHTNAWLVDANAQTGFGSSETRSLILAGNLTGRREAGDWQNVIVALSANYYHRRSEKSLFYAGIKAEIGDNLDLDNQLELGGENGLRGYPLRYQSGEKSLLLTLEQRYFTDWYPLRLFRVGGAVFFDVGRVWDNQLGTDLSQGTLRDIGTGLRLASARSGLAKMFHLDLAYPLDGENDISNLQVLFGTKGSF